MYNNRCTAKTKTNKRCKRTRHNGDETCIQHISMYPKQCMYVTSRFNRCSSVAPYGNEYCVPHAKKRIPIIIEESEVESDVESDDSNDSDWLPYNHNKHKPIVIEDSESDNESENESDYENDSESENESEYENDSESENESEYEFNAEISGDGSESICDVHNTEFYEYVEDEINPNIMLVRDAIRKTRYMTDDQIDKVIDYILNNIIGKN